MPLIGTAGHVDHGKSTLVQQITGRDPDRWEEEKRRGLTIDLGFAWATLPDGTEVSFVDVPGHERYVKNMLAGVEAIDFALFVVAGDEGWMPQSEEHLAVLDLLDVERGAVALTKVDVTDPDLLELASAEVVTQLAGTSLEGSPIQPVSGVTGQGVDELVDSLMKALPNASFEEGRPRLWVDRSFTIPGAGTVVTGSLLGGSIAVDQEIEIYPSGRTGRVRGLQSHERSLDSVGPGRRVAMNLGGISHDQIERGDMVGLVGHWMLTDRFSARLRQARYVDELTARGDYQVHVGSSAQRVDLSAFENGFAVFRLDAPLPLAVGDRFILRDTGRHLVVGGGQVLDPSPGRTRHALASAVDIDPTADRDELATRLLGGRRVDRATRLAAHTRGGTPIGAVPIGDRFVASSFLDELAERAVALVGEDHSLHPLRGGMPMATLAERLRIDGDIAETVVEHGESLERRGPDVALTDHQAALDPEQEASWGRAVDLLSASLAVPSESELGLESEVIHLKVRSGDLVRIDQGLVYLPSQIEQIKKVMSELDDGFTVAEFRDAAELSRKYAVPILEWSDREGLTVRRGDVRRIR